jgi:hypothetical protein
LSCQLDKSSCLQVGGRGRTARVVESFLASTLLAPSPLFYWSSFPLNLLPFSRKICLSPLWTCCHFREKFV